MKSEDTVVILPPSISLLDSTRKDFEALLGSGSSSSEKRRVKLGNSVKKHRLKKQESYSGDPVELQKLHSVGEKEVVKNKLVKVSSSHTNPTFWYEDESELNEKNSSSSSVCSSQSGKPNKFVKQKFLPQSIVQSVESTKQEAAIIIQEDHLSSTETSDIEGSHIVSSKAFSRVNSKSSPSVSLSQSITSTSNQVNKKRNSSQSSSPKVDEVNSKCEDKDVTLPLSQGSRLKLLIHYSDRLILDQKKSQPLVIVHAVNQKTGRYIMNGQVPVPPQFTGASKHKSSFHPEWNQEMIFDFDVSKYLTEVVFLFEILSEPNVSVSSHLAWGFLRPISKTGVLHTDKKIQLQLYKESVHRLFQTSKPSIQELFSWFLNPRKEKYPACLHITLFRIPAVSLLLPGISKTTSAMKNKPFSSPTRASRLSGQPFKLPTRIAVAFDTSAGALMANYNPDGTLLAVALTNGDIYVYKELTEFLQLKGHFKNVYDLQWETECRETGWRLLSCGADCTARIWNQSESVVLPHPAYVYSARFGDNNRIATGCFDQLIRLWELDDKSPHLINTYVHHAAPVNSLCWDSQWRLYSADAKGCISVWLSNSSGLHHERILNEFSEESRNQTPINCMSFSPTGARLLVHYRGSNLCLLDPKSGLKLMTYKGIFNPRLRLTSNISPCGSYVVSGSEDGSVHWFDLDRGDLVAVTAIPTSPTSPVMAIAFNPMEHAIALCSLNSENSLVVLESNNVDTKISGFSMTTFPRTVQSAVCPIGNLSNPIDTTQRSKTTSTLDKLERIFRKLDLVMTWSSSQEQKTSEEI